ncbi:hypothetical protein OPQ81_007502 [Rhizoctonia solani]|nr:hypothetical protein OPQ81_007502 [Rhizoctonia solani]
MSGLDDLSCPTIERWEKAGASLMTALKDYVDLCANLATDSLRAGAKPKYLMSKIDTTLATVHTAMSRDVSESTSALARTRNGLASPFSQFPEEVLWRKFGSFIAISMDFSGYVPPGEISLWLEEYFGR